MHARGWTLVESLLVLALLALAIGLTLPAWGRVQTRARLAATSRHLAGTLHALRWRSVAEGRAHGLWFRRDAAGWYWVEVRDGNGNGLRRDEIASGIDPLQSGSALLGHPAEGIVLGIPPGPGPLPRVPPSTGVLPRGSDPVRFGRSDLVSFTPLGTSTSGSLYVTDGAEGLHAVVVFGATARIRVWRFDAGAGTWRSGS